MFGGFGMREQEQKAQVSKKTVALDPTGRFALSKERDSDAQSLLVG